MTPNFIVKKSALAYVSIWSILFCWLIIPIIVMIIRILNAKSQTIEFYDDRIVTRIGGLSRKETQTVFGGVYSVSVSQSIKGRMFNYGDITVDCPGKWDVSTTKIKRPFELKQYLETKIVPKHSMTNLIFN